MNTQMIQQLQETDTTNQITSKQQHIPNLLLINYRQPMVNIFLIITVLSLILILVLVTVNYPINIDHLSHLFSPSLTYSHHHNHNSMGLPLFSIGIVPMGIISIGIVPMGVISIGIVPMGLISFGTVTMGLLSIGLVSMGAISSGYEAMGLIKYQNSFLNKIQHLRR
ncbi:MAG: hypothetical protein QNJ08_12595 [Crocosphaera sp.]|nr:hypothetical protein [Crocosphaera sp.]